MDAVSSHGRKTRGSWLRHCKRQSYSLDLPESLLLDRSESLQGLVNDNPCLRNRDKERYYLYLPRNLSYCQQCADVIKDHVQRKVLLLSSRLGPLQDLPPTPEDFIRGLDDDSQEDGIWFGEKQSTSVIPCSSEAKTAKRPILQTQVRTVSLPSSSSHRKGKKIVRFADSLGLDLESVRYIVKSGIPSSTPSSLYTLPDEPQHLHLVPLFLMPSLGKDYMKQLRKLNVCLHSISTVDGTVYGIVTVLNISYHKTVFIRYSVNSWLTCHDVPATYVEGSSENNTDKFCFTIYCNLSDLSYSGRVYFAICFLTEDGEEFWDNYNGKNYALKCEIKSGSSATKHSWIHFL